MPKIQKFRFLELVVVVALLLVILWGLTQEPKLHGAGPDDPVRNGAWCHANLKQLGLSKDLYAGDNKGNSPGPQPWGPAIPEVSWDKPIARQMGVVISPADFLAAPPRFDRSYPCRKSLEHFYCLNDPDQSATGFTPRSYSENLGDGLTATGIEPTDDKIPSSKVVSAAGTVFLMENQAGATAFGAANAADDTWIGLNMSDAAYEANSHRSDQFLFTYFTVHFGAPKQMVCKEAHYYYRKRQFTSTEVLMYDGHVETYKNRKEAWKSNTLPYVK